VAEDRFLLEPNCASECYGGTAYALFAVFDGHGGKQTSELCVRQFLPALQAALAEGCSWQPQQCDESPARALRALNAALPAALVKAFRAVDALAVGPPAVGGGSTATLCVVAGRTATLAAAGDSLAVLDSGSAAVRASAEHRVQTHAGERARLLSAGATVAPSTVDVANNTPCGCLRAWPGGLAVSRSIGDAAAKPAVIASPEVSQVSVPWGVGARLILASDGLWDAQGCGPKAAAAAARKGHGSAASAAAALVRLAASGPPSDDVTVLAIDFLPHATAKGPFATATAASTASAPRPLSVSWAITGTAELPPPGYSPPCEELQDIRESLPRQPVAPETQEWALALAAAKAADAAATHPPEPPPAKKEEWVAVPSKRKATPNSATQPPIIAGCAPVEAPLGEATPVAAPPAPVDAVALAPPPRVRAVPKPRPAVRTEQAATAPAEGPHASRTVRQSRRKGREDTPGDVRAAAAPKHPDAAARSPAARGKEKLKARRERVVAERCATGAQGHADVSPTPATMQLVTPLPPMPPAVACFQPPPPRVAPPAAFQVPVGAPPVFQFGSFALPPPRVWRLDDVEAALNAAAR